MREIKFRAMCDYDDTTGMVYFEAAKCDNGVFCMPNPNNISHIDEYLSPLMQFTGLKDKNAADIYEGDIIKTGTDKLMVITWNKKFASFCIERDGWAFSHWFGEAFEAKDCEVVGNIHETPELLTVGGEENT